MGEEWGAGCTGDRLLFWFSVVAFAVWDGGARDRLAGFLAQHVPGFDVEDFEIRKAGFEGLGAFEHVAADCLGFVFEQGGFQRDFEGLGLEEVAGCGVVESECVGA